MTLQELRRSVRQPLFTRGLLSAFLYLLLVTSVFGMLDVDAAFVVDVHVFIQAEDFAAALDGQHQVCRDCYLAFHVIDLLFILSFYPLLSTFARRLCPHSGLMAVTSLGAGAADVLENLAIDGALFLHPGYPGWLFRVVQVAMPLKFGLLGFSLAGMLVCRLVHHIKMGQIR